MKCCWTNIWQWNSLFVSKGALSAAFSVTDSPIHSYSVAVPIFASGKEQARWSARLSSRQTGWALKLKNLSFCETEQKSDCNFWGIMLGKDILQGNKELNHLTFWRSLLTSVRNQLDTRMAMKDWCYISWQKHFKVDKWFFSNVAPWKICEFSSNVLTMMEK